MHTRVASIFSSNSRQEKINSQNIYTINSQNLAIYLIYILSINRLYQSQQGELKQIIKQARVDDLVSIFSLLNRRQNF